RRRSPMLVVLLIVGGAFGLLIVLTALSFLVTAESSTEGTDTGDGEIADRTEPLSDAEPVDVGPTDDGDDDTDGAGPGDAESDFVTSQAPAAILFGEAAPSCTGRSDGVLRIGGLLPLSGDIGFLGPPMEAGAELAVADINQAGGVGGRPVEWIGGDTANDPDEAARTVDRLVDQEVDVIIGAATSALSRSVGQQIAESCVIQISPSNTSNSFTTADPADLYFRTAPADRLQAVALADLVVADGADAVYFLGVDLDYGRELVEAAGAAVEVHGRTVAGSSLYAADEADFAHEIELARAAAPDALILAGFGETGELLAQLIEAGFGPDRVSIYLVDGNLDDYDGHLTTPGALLGVKGTLPGAVADPDFEQRLLAQDPTLEEFSYGPEAYDAVVVAALAAEAAGSDSPPAVAARVNGVTAGGRPCFDVAQCLTVVGEGGDIDYQGRSGPLDFSRAGEPTTAAFTIMTYGPDNRLDPTQDVQVLASLGG
ncbi:MAG: ABC transporter substrate-binding protein, partial [Acidimicrobiales bacterium]